MGYGWGPAVAVGNLAVADVIIASGSLWVASDTANQVARINPTTQATIATITGFATPTRGLHYAFGDIWVGDGNGVNRVSTTTNAVTATISVPTVRCLTSDGTYVYAGHNSGIERIDPSTNTSVFTSIGTITDLVVGNGFLWATTSSGLLKRNLGTVAAVATITNTTNNFQSVNYLFSDIWASVRGAGATNSRVLRINASTNAVIATITQASFGTDLFYQMDSNSVELCIGSSSGVVFINASSNTFASLLVSSGTSTNITGLAANTDNRIWATVSDPSSNSFVRRIDLVSGIFTDGASHL